MLRVDGDIKNAEKKYASFIENACMWIGPKGLRHEMSLELTIGPTKIIIHSLSNPAVMCTLPERSQI